MGGGALMWRYIAMRKEKIQAATKIAALWRRSRGSLHVQLLQESAARIQKWWRDLLIWRYTSDIACKVLVQAKLQREAYLADYARVIQRCWRRVSKKGQPPIQRFKSAIITLQCLWRRYIAKVKVQVVRTHVGFRLDRLRSTQVVPVNDSQGRLTRFRDRQLSDNPEDTRLIPMVNIIALSQNQQEELGDWASVIQSLVKFQLRTAAVGKIRRVFQMKLARRAFQNETSSVIKIQAAWRAKFARQRYKASIAATVKVQAHMRRVLDLARRRREQDEAMAETVAAIARIRQDIDIVDGRRIRSGGSVKL